MLNIFNNIIIISNFALSLVYAHVLNYKYELLKKRDEPFLYYYDQLHDNEKRIYNSIKDQIESAIQRGHGLYDFEIYEIPVRHESEASLAGFRATSAFVMDNPKYFWIGHGNEQKITTLGNMIKEMHIGFKQSYTEDEIIKMYNEINKAVAPIVDAVNKIPTICEKLKYIHDYLIKLIVYKYGDDYNKYNIYGALIDHESVCEGYAEAFTFISQLTNIPTIIVNSETHEWNFVKMDDDKWYAMDVTYDDPKIGNMEFKSGNDKNKKYDYFLIGTESSIITDNVKMLYRESPDHKLLNYLLVESSTGFNFPELSDKSYNCPIDKKTNYIQDYYIPNKHIYIYVLIGLGILFIISFVGMCIRGSKWGNKRKSSSQSQN